MKEYPTDEQLKALIEALEQQELYAPKHLKQQILDQAFPKETVEVLPNSKRREKQIGLLAYRLKIIAGMAAAIIMLLLIPLYGMNSRAGYAETPSLRLEGQMPSEAKEGAGLNRRLNERARNANRQVNIWFEQTINLLNGNNGGNENEN